RRRFEKRIAKERGEGEADQYRIGLHGEQLIEEEEKDDGAEDEEIKPGFGPRAAAAAALQKEAKQQEGDQRRAHDERREAQQPAIDDKGIGQTDQDKQKVRQPGLTSPEGHERGPPRRPRSAPCEIRRAGSSCRSDPAA